MAWGNKNNPRDDTNHPKPQKLPPNGWSKPEQRMAEVVVEAVNKRSNGYETWDVGPNGERLNVRPEPNETRIVAPVIHSSDAFSFDLSHVDANEKCRMDELEKEMSKPKIKQIKDLMKVLTYGEMMDLAQQWADAMLTGTVDKDQFKFILPPTLHAWATSTPSQGEV